MNEIDDLLRRLRFVEAGDGCGDHVKHWHRNPDGPEAADALERLRVTDTERDALEAAIAWMAPVGNYDSRLRTTLQSLLARLT